MWGGENFLKIAKSTFLRYPVGRKFDEIALSRTVKEIEANLCFAIFGKYSKIQNGCHFWGGENFLKTAKITFLRYRTVKEIEAKLCFAIFGKNSKIQNGCQWGGHNDIDIECTATENIEFTALVQGVSMPVLYTHIQYTSSDINHALLSFVSTDIECACRDFILAYTAVGYTKSNINQGRTAVGKIELSALIRHSIFLYVSSVRTQPLGTLAVKYILGAQPVGTLGSDIGLAFIAIGYTISDIVLRKHSS